MRLGDVCNWIVLVNTTAFLAAFVLNATGTINVISDSFMNEGFCVKDPDLPYWSSHALAFYADVAGAAALLTFYSTSSLPTHSLLPIRTNIPAILAHGAGHMGLSFVKRENGKPAPTTSDGKLKAIFGLMVFWFFLLAATNPRLSKPRTGMMAAASTLIQVFSIPERFGFTYVQTILLWVAATAELSKPTKDIFYDLWAAIVAAPIGFVGWIEALGCDAGFKQLGGHVFYDAYIPLSMGIYFVLARYYNAKVPSSTCKIH